MRNTMRNNSSRAVSGPTRAANTAVAPRAANDNKGIAGASRASQSTSRVAR